MSATTLTYKKEKKMRINPTIIDVKNINNLKIRKSDLQIWYTDCKIVSAHTVEISHYGNVANDDLRDQVGSKNVLYTEVVTVCGTHNIIESIDLLESDITPQKHNLGELHAICFYPNLAGKYVATAKSEMYKDHTLLLYMSDAVSTDDDIDMHKVSKVLLRIDDMCLPSQGQEADKNQESDKS